jgi:hypothetical protein
MAFPPGAMGDFVINQRTLLETPLQFAACRNAGRAILPAAGFQQLPAQVRRSIEPETLNPIAGGV